MDRKSLTKMQKPIKGPVSEYVLHHAHCPVVIVKQKEQKVTKDIKMPYRLKPTVVAVDLLTLVKWVEMME